jgi:2-oxoglutarate ferredoxin oxidoreductase subunit gamma
VIAQGEIDHPEVIIADVLVAMSQEACDKYAGNLKKDGLLIVDQERVGRVPSSHAIKVPITRLAQESSGKSITANVVALGVLVGLTDVVSRKAITQAVAARAPKGTEEMNKSALTAGFAAADLVGKKHPRKA